VADLRRNCFPSRPDGGSDQGKNHQKLLAAIVRVIFAKSLKTSPVSEK
jgi:hypothetical protein